MAETDPQAAQAAASAQSSDSREEVFDRVGQLARSLHENLLGLGLDGMVTRMAKDFPDARGRLDYVARMTEQSAQRVLDATDAAMPLQERIITGGEVIAQDWRDLFNATFSESHYRSLADRTIRHLDDAREAAGETRQQLVAIMMAQDFQDLTGQVIKKVTELAHDVERQLVQLLVDYLPVEDKKQADGLMNGPQIDPNNKPDVVAGQEQVDDLLASMGF